jgi:DNA-binding NarL/FixJ family response regulator
MSFEIEILIADDHPVVRQGLCEAITRTPGFKLVAEAGNGQEALAKLLELKPQVALLDIDMPLLDGFSIAQTIRAEELDSKIIFLTVYREESFLTKALKVGAHGYILKDTPLAEIVAAIRMVSTGQSFVSPTMASYVVKRLYAPEQAKGLASLTPTERAVIKLIAECRTTKEISARLFISPRTVETHRANICQKLRLRGNHALTKFALAHQTELASAGGISPSST